MEERREGEQVAEGRGNQKRDVLASTFCFKNAPHAPPDFVFGIPGLVDLVLHV